MDYTFSHKRIAFLDFSAIISSFAVVTLHSSGTRYNFSYPSGFNILFILIPVIFSFGVPMFFMQSGVDILNYRQRYNTKVFWKKRTHKVIVPFLIWSIIAFIFNTFYPNQFSVGYGRGVSNLFLFIKSFFVKFFTGQLEGPYWFFYVIIGFYLIAPILSILVYTLKKEQLQYFLILAVIGNCLLPFLARVVNISSFDLPLTIVGGSLEYFLFGWYILNYPFSRKVSHRWYLLGILSLLAEIFGTFLLASKYGRVSDTFYNIGFILGFFFITTLFLFLHNHENFFFKFSKPLKYFAGLSFGIYLIHPFVLAFLNKYLIISHLTVHMIIFPIVLYLISGFVTWIVHKIPYFRNILP